MDKKWFVIGIIVGFVITMIISVPSQQNSLLELSIEACAEITNGDGFGLSECVYRASGQIYKYSCEVPDVPDATECYYDGTTNTIRYDV